MSDSHNPMGCSPLGSSVLGISQARILEWVAISFSRESSQPKDRTSSSCTSGGFFTTEPPKKRIHGWARWNLTILQRLCVCTQLLSRVQLCSPAKFLHGILQARTWQWVSMSSSPGYFPDPRTEPASPESAGRFFITEPPGKPTTVGTDNIQETPRLESWSWAPRGSPTNSEGRLFNRQLDSSTYTVCQKARLHL